MSRLHDMRQVFWLALQDFGYEWRMSACLVFGLAAVLTPLLVLFGLKFGLIDTMTARLLQDPQNREIKPVGSGHFGPDWFDALAAQDEVEFVVPRTRSIAATLDLQGMDGRPRRIVTVELIPTSLNDPLLADIASPPHEPTGVILSAAAARKLDIGLGQSVTGFVTRVLEGRREQARVGLVVMGILPENRFARDGAFVQTALLIATEDYRDGKSVPLFGGAAETLAPEPRLFASYRLYARTIDDVLVLRDRLAGEGLEVRTRAAEIETVKALDRNLGAVFWIIALVTVVGYLLSLASSLWANVNRKRRDLGILRLIGFATIGIVLFPVAQAGFIAVLGSGLAGGLVLVIQDVLNRLFESSLSEREFVCRLLPSHFAIGFVGTMGCAIVASALGGMRAAQIEPGEGLRDV